jgi:hypothetical protein
MRSSQNANFGFEKYSSWWHVINENGIMVDPAKVEEVRK